jgi:hypothetical protein
VLAFRRNSGRRGTTSETAAAFSGGLGLGALRRTGVTSARRQGDVSGAEGGRNGGRGVGARQLIGAAMANAHFSEAIEVAQEALPFRNEAGFAQEVVEMLLHRKRQE